MNTEIITPAVLPVDLVTRPQADSDESLIALWLHGRSTHTQRAYKSDTKSFLAFIRKTVSKVTLGDLQSFADSLDYIEPATKHRRLSAVKSLFAFAHRLGYLHFDVARPLRLPPLRDRLAERILSEAEVQRMLGMERQPRNQAILYVLYASGMRVSECCCLKWRDLQERADGGQVTIFGKGAKTNTILLPSSVWSILGRLRGDAIDEAPLFRSRKGKHLHPTQVRRLVLAAAKRAGIEMAVSPHWLRHGHASHALDRGAPIHLVQATLGHASISTTGRYLHSRPTESSGTYLAI